MNNDHHVHNACATKALILQETSRLLQATSFENENEGLYALEKVEQILDELHGGSDQHVIILNDASLQGIALQAELGALVTRLYNLLPLYEKAVSTSEKITIGFAVTNAFHSVVKTWQFRQDRVDNVKSAPAVAW